MGVGSLGDTDYSSSTWGNAVESEVSHGVVMRTRMCMVGVYGVRCDERINGGADGRSLGMIIIGMDVVVGAC